MKTCPKCEGTEFYNNNTCKKCARRQSMEWRDKNPEKVKQINARNRNERKKNKESKPEARARIKNEIAEYFATSTKG